MITWIDVIDSDTLYNLFKMTSIDLYSELVRVHNIKYRIWMLVYCNHKDRRIFQSIDKLWISFRFWLKNLEFCCKILKRIIKMSSNIRIGLQSILNLKNKLVYYISCSLLSKDQEELWRKLCFYIWNEGKNQVGHEDSGKK